MTRTTTQTSTWRVRRASGHRWSRAARRAPRVERTGMPMRGARVARRWTRTTTQASTWCVCRSTGHRGSCLRQGLIAEGGQKTCPANLDDRSGVGVLLTVGRRMEKLAP
ncbi:hypothetical protein [Sorangium sp. So ce887]|uniref:hypothetical protein n=1 Tax=Sorangium sp. So ce887 TaxID=3133324 RepID=UPI003F5F443B